MRYIALDVGTKKIGIAISDRSNTISTPLKVINFVDEITTVNELINIIKENEISHIIIGKPVNMDGTNGFATKRSESFKELLLKHINLPIIMIDERLTTVEAENLLINRDYSRKKRKKIIDSVAAVLILDTYLKMKGDNNEGK